MRKKLLLVVVFIAVLAVLLSFLMVVNNKVGEFAHGEAIGNTGYRYEVYHRGMRFSIMPGNIGGAGLLRVFDGNNKLVLEENIDDTITDIMHVEGGLHVPGGNTYYIEGL